MPAGFHAAELRPRPPATVHTSQFGAAFIALVVTFASRIWQRCPRYR
jgi:hypothetical protein